MTTRKAIRMICLWGVVLLILVGCGPRLPEGCPPECAGADLTNAQVTDEQLAKAKSLKGAIMPDGTKHE